jgi:hypothetical protein
VGQVTLLEIAAIEEEDEIMYRKYSKLSLSEKHVMHSNTTLVIPFFKKNAL